MIKNIFSKIKSLDSKSLLVLILLVALIFSVLFTIRTTALYPKNEIKRLKQENQILSKKNDSLILVNKNIDIKLAELDLIINNKNKKLAETELELKNLKKKRNEILIYVNRLSASDVARELSKYLDKATKGKNSR